MPMPTPHIDVKVPGIIAKTVIMPGDPLRAKFIAETYLENPICFNQTRGMLGYTGLYQGNPLSVMGSGMGMPSMGIYAYELFAFYDVDQIIRIGSAGSYHPDYKLYDLVLSTEAWTESSYANTQNGCGMDALPSSADLNQVILNQAKRLDIEVKQTRTHCTDVFYRRDFDIYQAIRDQHACMCVEMESFALFANAKELGKKAACLLTISDSLVTHEAASSTERQLAFTQMIEVALAAAASLPQPQLNHEHAALV